MTTQTIIKWLTANGGGSRRQVTAAIKRGGVAVNGQVIESFLHPVDPDTDRVTLDGKTLGVGNDTTVYLLLNKPKDVISTTSDDQSRRTVMDMIPKKYNAIRLYPVGRLDEDSTGLLLLTNDGDLTYHLTHPRFEHEKEYLLQIDGRLSPEDLRMIENGIELDDGKTFPARVRRIEKPPFNYSLVIHEGRKRQIRRMLAALGYRVRELKRVRMGTLRLGNLAEGEIRELTPVEVRMLKRPVGIPFSKPRKRNVPVKPKLRK